MHHRAFREATTRLRHQGVALEDWLGVDAATISRWESGTARIPSIRERQIRWLVQAEENRRKREAAGIPECDWLEQHNVAFAAVREPSTAQIESFTSELENHLETCQVCREGEAWANSNLVDPGPFPMAGTWGRLLGLLSRIPPFLLPAVGGAVVLGLIVAVRTAVVVVMSLVGGSDLTTAGLLLGGGALAAIAAAVAGAMGGLVVPLTRPLRDHLGAVGEYVTGVLVVWAYGLSIGVVAPLAFGERVLEEGYVPFALIYGALLGLAVVFMHRRDQAKEAKKAQ